MAKDLEIAPIGFREYDAMMKDLFTFAISNAPTDPKEHITLIPVTGPPKRELADLKNLTGEINKEGRANQTIHLPATSLSRLNFMLDLKRWTVVDVYQLSYSEDGNKIYGSTYPYPVEVMYQFDAWVKYQNTFNQIMRKVALLFTKREVWKQIDMKGKFGKRWVAIELLEGPKNLTNLDPGDRERTLRYTYTFLLKCWILPDAVAIPTVRSTHVGVAPVATTGELPVLDPENPEEYLQYMFDNDTEVTNSYDGEEANP